MDQTWTQFLIPKAWRSAQERHEFTGIDCSRADRRHCHNLSPGPSITVALNPFFDGRTRVLQVCSDIWLDRWFCVRWMKVWHVTREPLRGPANRKIWSYLERETARTSIKCYSYVNKERMVEWNEQKSWKETALRAIRKSETSCVVWLFGRAKYLDLRSMKKIEPNIFFSLLGWAVGHFLNPENPMER